MNDAGIDDLSPVYSHGSFSQQNLTEFLLADKISTYDSLDFSNNPIKSFKSLPILPLLEDLNLENTQIESFADAQCQPSLKKLNIKNTPLSMLQNVRVMCIIALGSWIEEIDGVRITPEESHAAVSLSPRLRKLLTLGWIISTINPLHLHNVFTDQNGTLDEVLQMLGTTQADIISPRSAANSPKIDLNLEDSSSYEESSEDSSENDLNLNTLHTESDSASETFNQPFAFNQFQEIDLDLKSSGSDNESYIEISKLSSKHQNTTDNLNFVQLEPNYLDKLSVSSKTNPTKIEDFDEIYLENASLQNHDLKPSLSISSESQHDVVDRDEHELEFAVLGCSNSWSVEIPFKNYYSRKISPICNFITAPKLIKKLNLQCMLTESKSITYDGNSIALQSASVALSTNSDGDAHLDIIQNNFSTQNNEILDINSENRFIPVQPVQKSKSGHKIESVQASEPKSETIVENSKIKDKREATNDEKASKKKQNDEIKQKFKSDKDDSDVKSVDTIPSSDFEDRLNKVLRDVEEPSKLSKNSSEENLSSQQEKMTEFFGKDSESHKSRVVKAPPLPVPDPDPEPEENTKKSINNHSDKHQDQKEAKTEEPKLSKSSHKESIIDEPKSSSSSSRNRRETKTNSHSQKVSKETTTDELKPSNVATRSLRAEKQKSSNYSSKNSRERSHRDEKESNNEHRHRKHSHSRRHQKDKNNSGPGKSIVDIVFADADPEDLKRFQYSFSKSNGKVVTKSQIEDKISIHEYDDTTMTLSEAEEDKAKSKNRKVLNDTMEVSSSQAKKSSIYTPRKRNIPPLDDHESSPLFKRTTVTDDMWLNDDEPLFNEDDDISRRRSPKRTTSDAYPLLRRSSPVRNRGNQKYSIPEDSLKITFN